MAEANGEKKTRTRAPRKPRPLFVLYRGEGDVEVLEATRNAADALALMDQDKSISYKRVDV